MAEGRKKKSTTTVTGSGDETAQRPQPTTSGEILRAARIQRGIGLEEISAAINIRVGQLRAIEEGNLAALPGMTYATGFVKSYAGYLKLNGAELVQKFKAEHGTPAAPSTSLHMPEPLPEGPRPNYLVIGIAGFVGVIILAIVLVFSGGDDKNEKQAAQIPQAPAVGTVTGITKAEAPAEVMPEPPPMPAAPAAAVAAAPAAPAETVAAAEQAPPAPTGPVILPVKPDRDAQQKKEAEAAAAAAAQPEQQADAAKEEEAQPPQGNIIKIRRGKSRITLVAKQASWIRVKSKDETLIEKVLRPGDQFFVPDQEGLELTTSNAGGLDVVVDGAVVQSLGKSGEIVRGVEMSPDELKITKVRARDRR